MTHITGYFYAAVIAGILLASGLPVGAALTTEAAFNRTMDARIRDFTRGEGPYPDVASKT